MEQTFAILKAHGISLKRNFLSSFLRCPSQWKKLSRRPSIAMDMEVIKFQLSQQEERMRKIILNRCFQWVIKEMKCIMMVMPLHVPSAATIFDVLFSARSNFRAFYSRRTLLLAFVRSSIFLKSYLFFNISWVLKKFQVQRTFLSSFNETLLFGQYNIYVDTSGK